MSLLQSSRPHPPEPAGLDTTLGQPMSWVNPGPFLMGSDPAQDPHAQHRELPQHQVDLPGYWIGRYPVTVAQFRGFVADSDHRPTDPGSLHGQDDHPVAVVTWHDAVAFCRWLGERAGLAVALPSEPEWEKAARGVDGRIYPWGSEPPDHRRCNFACKREGPTPVGHYSPQGDSPYGCADMVGNVWEWTRSLLRRYPYDPADGREEIETGHDVLRVLRGGSFLDGLDQVRCGARSWYSPSARGQSGGFRIVVRP